MFRFLLLIFVLKINWTDSHRVYAIGRRPYYTGYHPVRHYHHVVNNPPRYFDPLRYYYRPGRVTVYKCVYDHHCPPCHKCCYNRFHGFNTCRRCPNYGTTIKKQMNTVAVFTSTPTASTTTVQTISAITENETTMYITDSSTTETETTTYITDSTTVSTSATSDTTNTEPISTTSITTDETISTTISTTLEPTTTTVEATSTTTETTTLSEDITTLESTTTEQYSESTTLSEDTTTYETTTTEKSSEGTTPSDFDGSGSGDPEDDEEVDPEAEIPDETNKDSLLSFFP